MKYMFNQIRNQKRQYEMYDQSDWETEKQDKYITKWTELVQKPKSVQNV